MTPRKPNSRSSEVGDPMRRSFSGSPFQKPSIVANPRGFNPVTPANSPSDWAVRGRESNTMRFLRESEEKENARDSNNQKRAAAKSPSITNSKGMKNFMSPTISAASKINPSPIKKILTERNSHESEPKFDKELDLKDPDKVAVLDPADSLPGSDDIVEDTKPSFPSALEPIDADSLTPMTPYDPKTNFLAPRPKFLYYKPKDVDDGFFSDSFSESESTEETESDSSQNESDDAASSQVVVAKEEEEAAAADTEPNLHQSPGIEKEAVAVKERSRQHLVTKPKCIISAFILLLIACSTMMEMDHLQIARSYNSMIKESSFPVVLEAVSKKTEYLRSSAGENLRLWCDISVSYIGGLMSELRGENRPGQVIFFNLTHLEGTQWNDKKMENLIKDDDSVMSKIFEAEEEEEEGVEYDGISSIVLELDDDENSSCSDAEEVKSVEEAVEVKILEEPELVTIQSGEVEEEKVIFFSVEGEESETVVTAELVSELPQVEELNSSFSDAEEVKSVEEEAVEVKILEEPELVTIQSGEVEDEEEQKVIFSVEEEESETVVAAELESELPQVEIAPRDFAEVRIAESTESNFLRMTQIAALSSVLLSLVAGFVVALKKTRSSSSMAVVSNAAQAEQGEEQILVAKKFNISPVSGNSNLMAEFDFVGDSSWPSEIPMEKKRSGDVLMNPGKSSSRRRESFLAAADSSSSSDMSMGGSASPSLSYGSFTTYEMIPTKKKRNGDEELVITPLRRSSRLRK